MANKPTPVSVEARRLDISILPQNFSLPLTDYLVNQSDDLQGVANQANGAAEEAYQAQLTNEQQDEVLASHTETLQEHENRIDAAGLTLQNHETRIHDLEDVTSDLVKVKSEVKFIGLNLPIPQGEVNLIEMLSALPLSSGSFLPFFDEATKKIVVKNKNSTALFKLSMYGSWTGGSNPCEVTVSFSGGVDESVGKLTYTDLSNARFTLLNSFSVDVDSYIVLHGVTAHISTNDSIFVAREITMMMEQ